MNGHEIFINIINDNLNEMGNTIYYLYTTPPNSCVKNKLLNRLRRNIAGIAMLPRGLQNGASTNSPQPLQRLRKLLFVMIRAAGRIYKRAFVLKQMAREE